MTDTSQVTAYLAPRGYEAELGQELHRAGVAAGAVRWVHDRLAVVSGEPPVEAAWALNIWFDVETLPIASIGDAARQLRDRQRSWACFSPTPGGRAGLIAERLPHVSGRPLRLGELPPTSPLGSWTLVEPGLMLAAERCSSPFPNGEAPLVELREGPPSRAYRKLWETLVVLGRFPQQGERAVDLGASPGGWTWLLAQLGCQVLAVDKAPLHPAVDSLPGVAWLQGSAFGVDPAAVCERWGGPPAWVGCDIICCPERLFGLLDRWLALSPAPTVICTVKFRGATDHDVTDRLRALPGARLTHLFHNRHELTLVFDG
ncbi:MAG: hypothetical protein OEY41_08945 [Acidimicrobiia bacterium]|nr:hypothetical protein [Acidimicrobiia bacterium]MDH5290114.1 hypothetical protein [Acidimicrobiia bacterium]